jgi:hypothetical protein
MCEICSDGNVKAYAQGPRPPGNPHISSQCRVQCCDVCTRGPDDCRQVMVVARLALAHPLGATIRPSPLAATSPPPVPPRCCRCPAVPPSIAPDAACVVLGASDDEVTLRRANQPPSATPHCPHRLPHHVCPPTPHFSGRVRRHCHKQSRCSPHNPSWGVAPVPTEKSARVDPPVSAASLDW